jgi:hypothetical protein
MAHWWVDDVDSQLEDFGVDVIYGGVTFNGIYNAPYQGVNVTTGEIESSEPSVIVPSDKVTGVAHGDAITIDSTGMFVCGIEPDGTGVTVLKLRSA